MVTIHTNLGDVTLELFADKAPETVANFLRYAKAGHYSNTVFHRVIDGFMIQGGGFEPGLVQKPAEEKVKNEANNGISNETGTVAMARTMDPHSASAQFFINVSDNTFLDHKNETAQGWGYCVFGKVTSGMEVINQIKGVATGNMGGHSDVPKEDILITSVNIEE